MMTTHPKVSITADNVHGFRPLAVPGNTSVEVALST